MAFFDFHLSSTEVQKKILDARKRKFILNIDTDEIGYLSEVIKQLHTCVSHAVAVVIV